MGTFFYDINSRLKKIADQEVTKPQPLNESKAHDKEKVEEKWDKPTKVAPSEKGKYKGVGLKELRSRLDKLKKSGPHKKGSKEYGTMKELQFAIRAKTGWGKVEESSEVDDFVAKGGKIQQVPARPPRKSEKTFTGSRHIGGVGEIGAGKKTIGHAAKRLSVGKPVVSKESMSPKMRQKFAALAEPRDKITYADKIAGARKGMKESLPVDESGVDEGIEDRLAAAREKHAARTGQDVVGHKRSQDEKPKWLTTHKGKYGTSYQGDETEEQPAVKRGRGRPAGPKRAERLTAKGFKHKPAKNVKPGTRTDWMTPVAGVKPKKELDEKAVSQQQQKFMGMAHALQKGKKIPGASPALKKVARTMKPKDVEDFAKTKHKGLPKKKTEGKVEETTTSGSVATAPASGAPKSMKGMQFGKGIYDSLNRDLEKMIAEGMNVSVNMGSNQDGENTKSISINADGEDADRLAQLLNLAGIHKEEESCSTCGQSPCGCEQLEEVSENQPDWPTNAQAQDAHFMTKTIAGGLNKPKQSGQTTAPVVNRDPARGSIGPQAMAEDIGMRLYKEYQGYKKALEEDMGFAPSYGEDRDDSILNHIDLNSLELSGGPRKFIVAASFKDGTELTNDQLDQLNNSSEGRELIANRELEQVHDRLPTMGWKG